MDNQRLWQWFAGALDLLALGCGLLVSYRPLALLARAVRFLTINDLSGPRFRPMMLLLVFIFGGLSRLSHDAKALLRTVELL